MGVSEKKMKIVIDNYFKQECDVNTSIREAFEKGFRIGIEKGRIQAKAEQTEPQDFWASATNEDWLKAHGLEKQTEPQTCANGCKWLEQNGECSNPSGECKVEYRTQTDCPWK